MKTINRAFEITFLDGTQISDRSKLFEVLDARGYAPRMAPVLKYPQSPFSQTLAAVRGGGIGAIYVLADNAPSVPSFALVREITIDEYFALMHRRYTF